MGNRVRERVNELTAGINTRVGLDAAVSRGVLKMLYTEFPDQADAVQYEWDVRKMQISHETGEDD